MLIEIQCTDLFRFPQLLGICGVCVPYRCVTWVGSCVHKTAVEAANSSVPTIPLQPPPPPLAEPWQPPICPPSPKFFHLQMLNKWNHTGCNNLSGLDFLAQHNSLEIIHVVWLSSSLPRWHGQDAAALTVNPLRDGHLSCFHFRLLQRKLL